MFQRQITLFFVTLSAWTMPAIAQTNQTIDNTLTTEQLNKTIDSAFKYLDNIQFKNASPPDHWKGEFPSFIENRMWIVALGKKGKRYRDSNAFTTGLVYDELSQCYCEFKDRPQYSAMMNNAIEDLLTFRYGNTFNFWHALTPTTEMVGEQNLPKKTFRPNLYPLTNLFAQVRSNIANDADDTSVIYLDLLRQKNLAALDANNGLHAPEWLPQGILKKFDRFRDTAKRRYRYPFNVLMGTLKRTGAFLTWLTPEKVPFLKSPFLAWKDKLRIPEGVNNVDCVVNTNVLAMLSEWNLASSNSDDIQDVCHFIDDSVARKLERKCGVFYPNPYNLHYAVGKALRSGATCLKESAQTLYDRILHEQHQDGSWGGGSFHDSVESTLFATHALLDFHEALDDSTNADLFDDSLSRAMSFLYVHRIDHADSISWPEGAFFTGGGFVRRLLSWRSEAFSTALALHIFVEYKNLR